MLGARADPATARIEVDGVPVVVDTTRVVLAAEQAGRLRHDGERSAGPADGARARARRAARVPGRAARSRDRRACCCSPTTASSRELLTHPSHGVEKAYLAEVDGVPSPARSARAARRRRARRRTARGRCARRWCSESNDGGSALEIVMKEGRKRIVRRMCAEIGHPVRRLVRTRIGPLTDPKLAPGEHRALTPGRGAGAVRRARSASTRPPPD